MNPQEPDTKGFFHYLDKNPSPKEEKHKELWQRRQTQWRPPLRSPLDESSSKIKTVKLSGSEQNSTLNPADQRQSAAITSTARETTSQGQLPTTGTTNRTEPLDGANANSDHKNAYGLTDWLFLLHDLAWTASFASLNQNRTLSTKVSIISYVVFFTTIWWVWVAEVLYIIEYFKDDWVNMLFIFLQFIGFAVLASVTKDFDVTAFIGRTPGNDKLVYPPLSDSQITAEQYKAQRIAFNSIKIVTITIGALKALLFVKYVGVMIYAAIMPRWLKYEPDTEKRKRIEDELEKHGHRTWFFILPTSLFISASMFISAHIVSSYHGYGKTRQGAKTVWVLWAVGAMVEVVAHCIFEWVNRRGEANKNTTDETNVRTPNKAQGQGAFQGIRDDLVKRFGGITVIILSEGVNAIASSFWKLQQVQLTRSINASSLFCGSLIIFLLAYLYFEGPCPPKPKNSRIWWCLVHLPWLLSVILLLYAMKTHLLFVSNFDALTYMLNQLLDAYHDSDHSENLARTLLQGGTTLSDEVAKLQALQNGTTAPPGSSPLETAQVWLHRVFLDIVVRFYENFEGKDNISAELQERIDSYGSNYTVAHSDLDRDHLPELYDIWHELLSSDLAQGQYIMTLCGSTFICLATLSLLQSRPKDKFHWGSVLSRYAIGTVMALLALMNVGHNPITFPLESSSQWGPVFAWMTYPMVLPTIALAYAVQFIIDQVLLWLSVQSSRKHLDEDNK